MIRKRVMIDNNLRIVVTLNFILLLSLTNPFTPQLFAQAEKLSGFRTSPYFSEQVATFKLKPEMRIHINAPSADEFDAQKPVGLALYALPNGNTIEQTAGKILEAGDDWHYDIQHIAAQTRFLRKKIQNYNLVTVYLETTQKSWPAWKVNHTNYAEIIKSVVAYLKSYFKAYDPFIILTGHSGGGRFIFSLMDAFTDIPDYIDRICFLDSNYGYENFYGDQMIRWIDASPDHYISVLAYNDSVALYNGQPIVSPTGDTWYRSRIMQKYLAEVYTFSSTEDDEFIRHSALNGRIKFLLKKNPQQAILHTVQVERNGFIHTMLTGTPLEDDGYQYYGARVYGDLIQDEELPLPSFQIPLRSPDAMNGSQFMQSIINLSFADRETAILHELLTGNIPYFMRELKEIESTFNDANGTPHQVIYCTMPDYLAIGIDSNYCRIPMGPLTAQKAADFFGACMPTRKLVDHIYQNAEVKLAPVTYVPVGNQNESVQKFIEHNNAIQNQLAVAGATPGQLIGGTKKDVVLSNKIIDPARPNHVVIYGWHQLNGVPIQPLTNIHINTYVDYSHGIRLLDTRIEIDGIAKSMQSVLSDPILYKTVSDESGAMAQPTYIAASNIPGRPKSFGVKSEQDNQLKIIIAPEENVDQYHLYLSRDGLTFDPPVMFSANQHIIEDLDPDSIVYIKLVTENNAGTSTDSEVLAGLPRTAAQPKILVVNGFDRPTAGNTFNFIRQHAAAIIANGYSFDSATNDAVADGLLSLGDYPVCDYILGEESTYDECFSEGEQQLVAAFLKAGGRLFVSGAEIAWDLDYKGSPGDKAFFYDYLKAQYSADAPGGVDNTYYTAEGIAGEIFAGFDQIDFDNGTQGTFNVRYADAVIPYGGSTAIIRYKEVATHTIGGISFAGTFKDGTRPGRLVYLGFPFETIYPSSLRTSIMHEILSFLYTDLASVEKYDTNHPTSFSLEQNYPNPFNPSTTIRYQLAKQSDVTVSIFNSLGAKVREWKVFAQSAGIHTIVWDGTNSNGDKVSSGTYFYRMSSGEFVQSKKLVIMK